MTGTITDTLRGFGGSRLRWAELPADVRAGIIALLGAPVAEATSQPGGFSPGVAARLRLADGRRVFVKVAGLSRNPDSLRFWRREAEVLRHLPDSVPAARMLAEFTHGDWAALVFEDVPGRAPTLPWRHAELDRALAALARLADDLTPSPIPAITLAAGHAGAFRGWRSVAGGQESGAGLPDWVTHNLDRLADLEAGWEAAAGGDTLLHADLRADNLLLTADRVVLVDWAHACRGAAWIELLAMLPSVAMQGGPDPAEVWADHPVARRADPDRVTAVLAALAGFFLVDSLRPAPPNLPRLRAFQRAQGEPALRWLRGRLG